MKKILVFADTHGDAVRMANIVAEERDVTACFFLGDGEQDVRKIQEMFPKLPVHGVRGNCDVSEYLPSCKIIHVGELKIICTHGHQFCVKHSLNALYGEAKAHGADVALFGHTHMPHYEIRDGIHLFNPGSLGNPRYGIPSYGRILIENAMPHFEMCRYEEAMKIVSGQ